MRGGFILLMVFTGCGNLPQTARVSIPRLRHTHDSTVTHSYVRITVDPITTTTWRNHPELAFNVLLQNTDTSSQFSTLGTDPSAPTGTTFNRSTGPPGTQLRYEEMLIVPLPAFRVGIVNGGTGDLDVSHARAFLNLGPGGRIEGLRRRAVLEEVEGAIRNWALRRQANISPEQQTAIRAAARRLPLMDEAGMLPNLGTWIGFIVHKLNREQLGERVVLSVEGLTLDGQPLPPFEFPFVIERRHAARACPDGRMATPLGECRGDEDEIVPAAEGPCVQKTRMPLSDRRKQWWIGGEPVADSDVSRTLLSSPPSARVMRRSLVLQGVGYTLVGVGLLVSAMTTFAISQTAGANVAPAGLGFVSLSIIGAGVGWKGASLRDRAIRVYNEDVEAAGTCGAVW